jgi:hypothetical protein
MAMSSRPGAPTPPATDERPAGGAAELPRPPDVARRRVGWTGGRITALVIGVLLTFFSVVLLGAGGTALWATWTQRDDGYITTDAHAFSTGGSALVTERAGLGSAGVGWLYAPALLDEVRVRVTPESPASTVVVGIGPSADVDRYLAGVNHTVISDLWTGTERVVGGGTQVAAPGAQDFWVATDTGSGPRTVTWEPTEGSWSVVVMNADASPGLRVRADLGATMPAVVWIALGLLLVGGLFLAGGVILIVGAFRAARSG